MPGTRARHRRDPQIYFRMDACDALREIGPAASEAVPQLIKIVDAEHVDEEQALLRLRAAHALFVIGGDVDRCVSVALRILEGNYSKPASVPKEENSAESEMSYWLPCWACDVLAELGRSAKAAIPRLRKVLHEERNEFIRTALQKAILKIEE